MNKSRLICLMTALFAGITLFSPGCSDHLTSTDIGPDELAEKMIKNPDFVANANGENFCWHARVGLDRFVENYEISDKTEWLEAGIKYFDFLIGKMVKDPDGYLGWIGPYGYDERYWQDALVGDAILLEGILDFSVLVLEDRNLSRRFGAKATGYAKIAERDFFEKWDHRGCWIDDGSFGTYIEFDKYLKADNLKEWLKPSGEPRAGISHPFNKQMDAAQVCLRLWRITGEKKYRDRAKKIYFTAKSHFQYFDNHYCWNYYEPLYQGDIDTISGTTRHGVWVHPWRSGYQASEAEKIAEAYHYGIVFDEQDIRRIINTNLKVMWNGDRVNPRFINSNGLGADFDTSGIAEFRRNWGHSNATCNAGELWTGLLDFDQTVRDLYELRFRNKQDNRAYDLYKKTVLSSPPGFTRKYAKGKVDVPEINFTESRELCMATVLPHSIEHNHQSIIICKSWIPGILKIDLYSTGNTFITNIFTGKINDGTFMVKWNGKDPGRKNIFRGDYKIRWTLGTGCREYPIVISD